jgi:F0F1-type ATP synthase assembly protein I
MRAGGDSPSWRGLGPLLHLGLTFVACIVIGLGGGFWLDRALGTSPWLLLAGLGIGIAAGFVNLFRAMKIAERSEGTNGD